MYDHIIQSIPVFTTKAWKSVDRHSRKEYTVKKLIDIIKDGAEEAQWKESGKKITNLKTDRLIYFLKRFGTFSYYSWRITIHTDSQIYYFFSPVTTTTNENTIEWINWRRKGQKEYTFTVWVHMRVWLLSTDLIWTWQFSMPKYSPEGIPSIWKFDHLAVSGRTDNPFIPFFWQILHVLYTSK